MTASRWTRGLSVAALVVMAGCSGTTQGAAATMNVRPFAPELAQVFDDAVDYLEDVSQLGGRAAADWRRQVQGLARESDVIVTVRIETVTGGEDQSSRSYRLTAVGTRTPLKGQLEGDHRVDLRVNEGDNGFNTVRGNFTRLQSGEFLMFLRWAPEGDEGRRARWHLSPASPALIQQVRDALGYLEGEEPGAQGTTTTTTTSN